MFKNIKQLHKFWLMLTFLLAISVLLAGCTAPTSEPEPTAVPAPTQTPEIILVTESLLEPIDQTDLVGVTWQWIGLRETMPAAQSLIPDAYNYTLTFNEDGTVNIKADCNAAMGSYQLTSEELTISLGPTTLAECGPDSSYSQFLSLLEQAASVGTGYGNLVITLADDAGEMFFSRTFSSSLATDLSLIAEENLVDTLWQWVSLIETMPASQSMIADSENYNLVFRSDGTYSAKADCNQLMGSYELLGTQLRLEPGISTLAECGSDSSYGIYSSLLGSVIEAGMRDGVLVLVLADDAGIMNFNNAGEAPEAMEPQAIEGDPASILGLPDSEDDFDKASNWTRIDSSCFKSEITGGQYVMTAKGLPENLCWEVSWAKIQNFYLETLAETPEACDPLDRYGVLLRAPDNNRGYLFGLDCSGKYSLLLWDGEKITVLVEPSDSDAILTEPGTQNRLGVAVSGSNFYLYANGVYLNQAEDLTFLDEGKFGYFVRAATEQPFQAKYDYLKLWILDDTFYPPQASDPGFPISDLPEPPTSSAAITAKVNVNVRSGPGMQFKVITVLLKGDSGEALGISPDGYWLNVPIPPGVSSYETGWVAKDYVDIAIPSGTTLKTITPPLLPGLVPVEPPAPNAPAATTLESGAIRMGPGIEYPIYGLTTIGVQISVLGKSEDGEWWAIKLPTSYAPEGLGWINKVYVKTQNAGNVKVLTAPAVPPDARPTAPGGGQPSAKAVETINVLSGPGNQYKSYGKVQAGTIMAVTGISSDGNYWVILLPTDIASNGRGWVPINQTNASKTDNGNVPVIPSP